MRKFFNILRWGQKLQREKVTLRKAGMSGVVNEMTKLPHLFAFLRVLPFPHSPPPYDHVFM